MAFSIRSLLRSLWRSWGRSLSRSGRNRQLTVVLSVAGVFLLGAVIYALSDSPKPQVEEFLVASAASAPVVGAQARQEPMRPLITDPADARPDVARLFELDAAGHLVIDSDTGVALEALVGDLQEQPSPLDVQRTEEALRKGLPPHEAARAISLLRSYRAYVAEVESQVTPGGIPQSLTEINALFDRMAALRLKHFDRATADALFGSHEAYARYTMQTTFIEQDHSLSGPAKQAQLDRLRTQLPDDVKALIPPLSPEMERVELEVARLRREGAADEQIEAYRQSQSSPAPASASRPGG